MATLRELKGRIGSVASTEKITGAMKMISSAKMRKAEQALRKLTPFRESIRGIMANLLASDAEFASPLMDVREIRRLAIVAFGSDDGLCGAYNSNLAKFVDAYIAEARATGNAGESLRVELHCVGAKMLKAAQRLSGVEGLEIRAAEGVDSRTDGPEIKAMLEGLIQRFLAGEIDSLELAYMHYHSAGRQRAVTDRLLPVDTSALAPGDTDAQTALKPYIYEPDAASIFSTLLPMHLLATLQEAFAENRASEQAARVMAMQAATDNARKLLEQLQLEYNKLRQQSITTELLDIVGGQVRD
ncbi:MAG: ATP synthase F1 subunit gamma [Muribaculaceae bacterium]|nr:ATP synthase F1 subunit gamma [Muribaculaceae bacterium]